MKVFPTPLAEYRKSGEMLVNHQRSLIHKCWAFQCSCMFSFVVCPVCPVCLVCFYVCLFMCFRHACKSSHETVKLLYSKHTCREGIHYVTFSFKNYCESPVKVDQNYNDKRRRGRQVRKEGKASGQRGEETEEVDVSKNIRGFTDNEIRRWVCWPSHR